MADMDVLGVGHVVKSVADGASAVLGRICLPACEELGEFFRDKVKQWRLRNTAATLSVCEKILDAENVPVTHHAPPRLVLKAMEETSKVDDHVLQEMWAGLIVSSCSEDGEDDSNLIFMDMMTRLTRAQARLLNHIVKECAKECTPDDLVVPSGEDFRMPVDEVFAVTGIRTIYVLDHELDHLRALGLIGQTSGFTQSQLRSGNKSRDIEIAPTAIAMSLVFRCSGSSKTPRDYFGV